MLQRANPSLLDSLGMYMERVYRLQVEFCEVSLRLANAQALDLRGELTRRRLEIVAEASELVHILEIEGPIQRVPARSSQVLQFVGASAD